MKTANLVILESSEEFMEELKAYFEGKDEFNVCAVTGNGNAGIGYIDQYKPDVVILNLVLSGRDGFASSTTCATTVTNAGLSSSQTLPTKR